MIENDINKAEAVYAFMATGDGTFAIKVLKDRSGTVPLDGDGYLVGRVHVTGLMPAIPPAED